MTENGKIWFWARQVDDNVTNKQNVFDILFGIVIPILCLVFDPIVFQGGYLALLGEYSIFAYSMIGLGICSLGLWMLIRDQLPFELLACLRAFYPLAASYPFFWDVFCCLSVFWG